jgi:protein regulator of cytokinesis 1
MSRPSLTSLLNSLHTHLQSQTQLLPTFHAQLGLPPTALEDDLAALHQRLVHSVEQQVDARRKEVENWVEKCRAIETECTNYAKLLGASAKAAGTTVGDLRSETILPKRYELVSEYQEKLRQVSPNLPSPHSPTHTSSAVQLYHTKLEQLTTLTNRITTLSRTLGPDFYAYDIVESVLVTSDRPAFRDVTPERFLRLEKELVRGKGEVVRPPHVFIQCSHHTRFQTGKEAYPALHHIP